MYIHAQVNVSLDFIWKYFYFIKIKFKAKILHTTFLEKYYLQKYT